MDFVSCNYLLPHVCYVISFMFSDPQVQKSFVDALYAGGPFLQSLPNALAPDGFLLAQVGEASGIDSPSEEHSLDRNRVKFIQSLVDLGFESVRDYEEVRIYLKEAQAFIDLILIVNVYGRNYREIVVLDTHGNLLSPSNRQRVRPAGLLMNHS